MAKKAYVYNGSAWEDLASSVSDLSSYATTVDLDDYQLKSVAGLEMLVNRDFAATASESFTNVFSATYSRYRVLISAFSAVGTPILNMQFRQNVTNVTTLYFGGSFQIRFDGVTAGVGFNSIGAIPVMPHMHTTGGSVVSLDIYRSATEGIVTGTGFNGQQSGSYQVGANRSGMTNFTGFTIAPESSTMTGNVKIYGYKEVI